MACEGTCQICNNKGDMQVTIQTLSPNKPDGYYPNDLVEITVTVQNHNLVLPSHMCACLFDIDGGTSLGIVYQLIPWSTTYTFTFPPFVMGDVNRNLHLSIVAGAFSNACTDFRNFTVKVIAPSGSGYSCNNVTRLCDPDSNSTKTRDQCNIECSGRDGGASGCVPACAQDSMCLFGSCVKRSDILIAGAAILAFMYISKQ